jgi:cell filamentation protein
MNKEKGRYDTSGLIDAQVEPGSRGRVLKNLLGIKSKREMDQVEAREHLRALDELVDIFGRDHRFTADDIRRMHAIWLGNVYEWAGSYRSVNISKEGFLFAASGHLPRLMTDFERGPLREFTPCIFEGTDRVAHALAVVHVELVLIHPFREGNGRLARMLSILMALQAGLPPLDFGSIKGKKKKEYFAAVQAGLDRNYEPMEKIFSDVIGRTLRIHGRA